jgi:hypothetical protein
MYLWNQLGRGVRKSEKTIHILTPMIGIQSKMNNEAETGDDAYNHKPVLVGRVTA